MKFAYYASQGPANEVLQLGEETAPEPAPGEVLIRLHTSGVNPVDGYVRAGAIGPMAFRRIVPGLAGAGVIVGVGSGVGRDVGERVWVYNAQWQRAFGTVAEYVTLPERLVVRLLDQSTSSMEPHSASRLGPLTSPSLPTARSTASRSSSPAAPERPRAPRSSSPSGRGHA